MVEGFAPRRLFNWMGIEWRIAPSGWLHPLWNIALGIGVAFVIHQGRPTFVIIAWGILFGAISFSTFVVHALGHLTSSRLVGAPLDGVTIIWLRFVTVYNGDQADQPRRVNVGRALGGPVANLLVGMTALAIWKGIGGLWLGYLGAANLLLAALSLAPVPDLDGGVIWGELLTHRNVD